MRNYLSLFLWLIALSAGCWGQSEKRPSHDLVEVHSMIPDMIVDLRYATPNNFMKKRIYQSGKAWLRPEALKRLARAQRLLEKRGYQIVLLDAYRPKWAQYELWKAFPNANFVAPPTKFSRHSRGISVDITLADDSGKLLKMPSDFDEFTKRADHDFSDVSETAAKHGNILRKVMFKVGFSGVPDEWWHYDLRNWKQYPAIDEKVTHLWRP